MKKVHYFLVVGFMMVFISINAQEKQEEKDESVNTLFGGKGENAQEKQEEKDESMNTLFGGKGEKVTYGGFGGPKFGSALLLDGNWYLFSGGKGGVLINRKYVIGLEGNMIHQFTKDERNFSYSQGGFLFEYIPNITKSIHLSYGTVLGGGVIYEKDSDGKKLKNKDYQGLFCIKPHVSLNFNFAKFFIGSIDMAYTWNFANSGSYSIEGINIDDASGLNFGFTLKFGKF